MVAGQNFPSTSDLDDDEGVVASVGCFWSVEKKSCCWFWVDGCLWVNSGGDDFSGRGFFVGGAVCRFRSELYFARETIGKKVAHTT